MFAGAGTNPGEKTLEDKFFEKEVRAPTIYMYISSSSSSSSSYLDFFLSLSVPGGDQHAVVHAAVPLWSVLLLHASEGAGVSQRGVDRRVHRAETQIQD